MLDRRDFLLGVAALGLAACGKEPPPPPTVLNLGLSAQPGANAAGGGDRPLTVTVLRLKDVATFQSADYQALQDPTAALGGDLVGMDQVVLGPGGNASRSITFEDDAAYVGIVAAYRDPNGVQWRSQAAVPRNQTTSATASFTPAGVVLSMA
ncbi:MAG TPA: type VI secretion system lipoprotein TssJ [Thermohalobaculum sp.]|nr:type VI secretion system lipoprotein TssJ [Thermohalobaculum sp.]